MQITVIGSWGGSPRVGGACSGYLVEDDQTKILIDCGSGVAGAVQYVCPLEAINHVVLSHFHFDHASDAGSLVYARLVQRKLGYDLPELVVYAPRDPYECDRLVHADASRVVCISEDDEIRIGSLTLAFLRTKHPVMCLAVRVTSDDGTVLTYTADGEYTAELAAFAQGSDVVVTECSLYGADAPHCSGHMDVNDVIALARAVQPRVLVVGHLPVYGDVHQIFDAITDALASDAWMEQRGCKILLADIPCNAQGALKVRVSNS